MQRARRPTALPNERYAVSYRVFGGATESTTDFRRKRMGAEGAREKFSLAQGRENKLARSLKRW